MRCSSRARASPSTTRRRRATTCWPSCGAPRRRSAVMRGDGDVVNAIALHPDGRTLAVGDDDGTVVFLDAVTRRRLGRPHESGLTTTIISLAFSPDGSRLASSGLDARAAASSTSSTDAAAVTSPVWGRPSSPYEPSRARPSRRIRACSQQSTADDEVGTHPALGCPNREPRSPRPAELPTGAGPLRVRLRRAGRDGGAMTPRSSATPPRCDRYAGSPPPRTPPRSARPPGSSRSGRRTARCACSTSAPAHCAPPRGATRDPWSRCASAPAATDWSPPARDERLIVWDPRRATVVETLAAGGIGLVQDLEVTADGRTAYSGGRDGTVIAWDLTGERRWERRFDARGTAPARRPGCAVTADGSQFAVIDRRRRRPLRRPHAAPDRPLPAGRAEHAVGAALAPDGGTLAMTTDGGMLELWDPRTRRRLVEPQIAHAQRAECADLQRRRPLAGDRRRRIDRAALGRAPPDHGGKLRARRRPT